MGLGDRSVGVCLSSGYFGFFAHAGAVLAFEELGIRPRLITGCSAGALVGGLWASGMSAAQVRDTLLGVGLLDLLDPPDVRALFHGPLGLVSGRKMESGLAEALPVGSFEQCPVPFSATVFDLHEGAAREVSSGPLARGIRASASLPGMFMPVDVDGHSCIDGGVAVKAPLRPFLDRDDIDTVLVCYLSSGERRRKPPRSLYGAIRLALDALVQASDRQVLEELRRGGREVLILAPKVERCGPHRLDRGPRIVEQARREVLRIMETGEFGSEVLY